MKKNFLALGICTFALALGLVACDDSTSANGSSGDENPAEVSSSSILTTSSTTEDPGSSSSSVIAISSGTKQSSSSVIVSSSSSAPTEDPGSSSGTPADDDVAVVKPDGYYGNSENCPAGLDCKYATTTEYLNSFKTYGEILDSRDGQVYKTIEICDKDNKNCQTWMAQNLNYRYVGVKFNYNGNTSDSTSWCGGGSGTTAGDCSIYGRLYTWAAAIDSVAIYEKYGEECGYGKSCTRFSVTALATAPVRGVCLTGWHLPSSAEWSALYTNVGGTGTAGQKLKAKTSLWYINTGTDKYGFSVLPAGLRNSIGDFYNEGSSASLWSASENSGNLAWYQYFRYSPDSANQSDFNKDGGLSLRCLKD